MDKKAFQLLHEAERSWWYRGRARIAAAVAARAGIVPSGAVLDLGAGYGGMRETLSRLGGEVYAFEPEISAAREAQGRGYAQVYTDLEAALARTYRVIALFDVIEHVADDRALMIRIHSALEEGGYVLITTPAFPFLWSRHDILHHHYRRYRRRELRALFEENGYGVEYISYWNFFLFPLAALTRLLNRSGEGALGTRGIIAAVCEQLIAIEAALLRVIVLPWGVSFVAVARKR